jgi:hypothetical protein
MSKPSQIPFVLKTSGYLVSSFSVLALGIAAWPGADDADLLPWLILGMIASIAGMVFRWSSYYLDKRRSEKDQEAAKASPPGTRPVPGPV